MASIESRIWLMFKITKKLEKLTVQELVQLNFHLSDELLRDPDNRFNRWPLWSEEAEDSEAKEVNQYKANNY